MEHILFVWELIEEEADRVMRHCPNCNQKVEFLDSKKRRRNASGRDIYEYAIYKCAKGHTWNKFIKTYKAMEQDERSPLTKCEPKDVEIISIEYYRQMGKNRIEIVLEKVRGRWRLDKLLAEKLEGWSRSQVERRIERGQILVNNELVKPGMTLKSGQRILIELQ